MLDEDLFGGGPNMVTTSDLEERLVDHRSLISRAKITNMSVEDLSI